jgi:hypothetical protein
LDVLKAYNTTIIIYFDLQGPLQWRDRSDEQAQHYGMDLELRERQGAEWGRVALHVEH